MLPLANLMANVVAAAHIGYFLFVVGGVVAIVIGAVKRSEWIRSPWFRLAHLAAVYIVIIEDVFNIACPLNTIEWKFRSASDSVGEASSTAGRFLDYLLRQTIPGDVLHAMYWTLGVIVPILLLVVPLRFRTDHRIGKPKSWTKWSVKTH